MTVYVDDYFQQATVPNGKRTVTGKWCHMTADTREELDAMAVAIGMRPAWIQHPGTWKEHYDVVISKRNAAVRLGAVEVEFGTHTREMLARFKKQKAAEDAAHRPTIS